MQRVFKRCFSKVEQLVLEKEYEEALELMRREFPKAYEYYRKHEQYEQEYIQLTKDAHRPLQTQSDELARVAAQCGLKLPKVVDSERPEQPEERKQQE